VKFAVIPFCSSAFSAFGIGRSDVLHVKEASEPMVAPFDLDKLNSIYSRLEGEVLEMLKKEGFREETGTIALSRWMKLKYKDQVHEIRTPVPLGTIKDEDLQNVVSDFESTLRKEIWQRCEPQRSGNGSFSLPDLWNRKDSKERNLEERRTIQRSFACKEAKERCLLDGAWWVCLDSSLR